MMLITMPLLGFTEEELLTGVAVIGPAAAAVGLIIWFAPWGRWPDAGWPPLPSY